MSSKTLEAAKGDQDETKESVFQGWHLVALFVAFARDVGVWGDFESCIYTDADINIDTYRDLNVDTNINTYSDFDAYANINTYINYYSCANTH